MPNVVRIPVAAGAFDPSDITIDDNTSGAFLIKEGSNEYMRIDTTNGSELTQFKMPFTTGEFKYIQETSAGPYEFIKANATSVRLFPGSTGGGFNFSHMTVSTGGIQIASGNELNIGSALAVSGAGMRSYISQSGHSWTELLVVGATSKIQRIDGFKMLEVDTDSNTTFTLDDTSGATFKVTDDGASPKLFFSATEGGNTFVQSDSSTFLDGGGAIYIRVGTGTRIRADGGALYLGGTGKYNIVDAGTSFYNKATSLVDLGATTGTTVVSTQADGAYKTFKCTPTTLSQTFTLEFQDGTSANGDYVVEQDFAIYNAGTENCTIQSTITSGRGSALGKDLSAGGSTSGELVSGMTLNAGKSALFKAVKWNKILDGSGTSADNEFMFQTIMVEA
jgi:hypothetical protein